VDAKAATAFASKVPLALAVWTAWPPWTACFFFLERVSHQQQGAPTTAHARAAWRRRAVAPGRSVAKGVRGKARATLRRCQGVTSTPVGGAAPSKPSTAHEVPMAGTLVRGRLRLLRPSKTVHRRPELARGGDPVATLGR